MVRRSLDRTFTAWLLFILIAIAASTWLSYYSLENILRNEGKVAFSQIVMDELDATLSTVKDAETGQRGFLLTGDEAYLEPYNTAVTSITEHLGKLRSMTAADADQQS